MSERSRTATGKESRPPADSRKFRGLRLLTRLYPRRFRDDFEDEMLAVMNREAEDQGGGVRFWLRSISATLRGAAVEHLGDVFSDLRYGLRTLRRRPGFLLIAVASLGVGIAATTTVVATLDEIFLEGIEGIEGQSRLINVKIYSDTLETFDLLSWPDYEQLVRAQDEARRASGSASVSDLAAFGGSMLSVSARAGRLAPTASLAGRQLELLCDVGSSAAVGETPRGARPRQRGVGGGHQ